MAQYGMDFIKMDKKTIAIIIIMGMALISLVTAGIIVNNQISLSKEQITSLSKKGITSPKVLSETCWGDNCVIRVQLKIIDKTILVEGEQQIIQVPVISTIPCKKGNETQALQHQLEVLSIRVNRLKQEPIIDNTETQITLVEKK